MWSKKIDTKALKAFARKLRREYNSFLPENYLEQQTNDVSNILTLLQSGKGGVIPLIPGLELEKQPGQPTMRAPGEPKVFDTTQLNPEQLRSWQNLRSQLLDPKYITWMQSTLPGRTYMSAVLRQMPDDVQQEFAKKYRALGGKKFDPEQYLPGDPNRGLFDDRVTPEDQKEKQNPAYRIVKRDLERQKGIEDYEANIAPQVNALAGAAGWGLLNPLTGAAANAASAAANRYYSKRKHEDWDYNLPAYYRQTPWQTVQNFTGDVGQNLWDYGKLIFLGEGLGLANKGLGAAWQWAKSNPALAAGIAGAGVAGLSALNSNSKSQTAQNPKPEISQNPKPAPIPMENNYYQSTQPTATVPASLPIVNKKQSSFLSKGGRINYRISILRTARERK